MTILPADNKMSERAQLKNLSIIKDKTYDRGLNMSMFGPKHQKLHRNAPLMFSSEKI